MEQDCPPYLSTYRGIEEGSPRLLKLLEEKNISATFFVTGDVAKRYPEIIDQIVKKGHELASHGHTHRRFDQMTEGEAEQEIFESLQILRQFYPVISFRAPNLEFPESYLVLLEKYGVRIDSSLATYKFTHRRRIRNKAVSRLQRFPASMTSSVLRLPQPLRRYFFWKLQSPAVLFIHPWEFVDFRKSKLRLDCRFKTGYKALACMRENIAYFTSKGAKFVRMNELLTLRKEGLFSTS